MTTRGSLAICAMTFSPEGSIPDVRRTSVTVPSSAQAGPRRGCHRASCKTTHRSPPRNFREAIHTTPDALSDATDILIGWPKTSLHRRDVCDFAGAKGAPGRGIRAGCVPPWVDGC